MLVCKLFMKHCLDGYQASPLRPFKLWMWSWDICLPWGQLMYFYLPEKKKIRYLKHVFQFNSPVIPHWVIKSDFLESLMFYWNASYSSLISVTFYMVCFMHCLIRLFIRIFVIWSLTCFHHCAFTDNHKRALFGHLIILYFCHTSIINLSIS